MSIRIDGTNTTANPGITGGDADTGLQFGTNEISFVTGGTNRATVENNGNFTIENGNLVLASGGGIDFSADSNAAGMTSELLDDYEEGTWTPVICGVTPTINSAYYTKIGRLVIVKARVNIITAPSASTDPFAITGLPFSASAINGYNGFLVGYTSDHNWPGNLNGGVSVFYPEIRLFIAGTAAPWTVNDYRAIRGTNDTLEFQCTYFV